MDRNNENTRLNTIPSEVYDAAKTQENNISFAKVKINEPEVKEEEALPDEANTQEIKPKKKAPKPEEDGANGLGADTVALNGISFTPRKKKELIIQESRTKALTL